MFINLFHFSSTSTHQHSLTPVVHYTAIPHAVHPRQAHMVERQRPRPGNPPIRPAERAPECQRDCFHSSPDIPRDADKVLSVSATPATFARPAGEVVPSLPFTLSYPFTPCRLTFQPLSLSPCPHPWLPGPRTLTSSVVTHPDLSGEKEVYCDLFPNNPKPQKSLAPFRGLV